MSEDAETRPVKRGPGRPRKVVPQVVADPPDAWKTVDPELQLDDLDRQRIGQAVNPTATAIGFSDGRQYRCDNGEIVERVS